MSLRAKWAAHPLFPVPFLSNGRPAEEETPLCVFGNISDACLGIRNLVETVPIESSLTNSLPQMGNGNTITARDAIHYFWPVCGFPGLDEPHHSPISGAGSDQCSNAGPDHVRARLVAFRHGSLTFCASGPPPERLLAPNACFTCGRNRDRIMNTFSTVKPKPNRITLSNLNHHEAC